MENSKTENMTNTAEGMKNAESTVNAVRYEDAPIDERIIRAVQEMGFEVMTPIQQQAIPALLEGRDVLGQAQTGTGKTAAFGIPMIQRIDPEVEGVQCIILCPTRELAIQAAEELRKFAKFMHGIKILPIYGGQDISKQIRSLKGNVSIIVGTPGRVMDHMRRHTLRLENIKAIVLDEADEMLNMGFREDIETILKEIPEDHQTALFSATMPKPILDITHTYQKDAVHVKVAAKEVTIPLVKQYYYEVQRQNKAEVTARLLDYYNPKRSLIFCNTKKMVDDLTEELKGRGYFAEGLHGDMSQFQRDKVMNGFRNGTVEILIATDVAARGIDVDDVEAVFNYDVPQDIEYYVHRIGRTGRAGRTGRSFTLVVGREIYKIREIENVCHTKIKARTIPSAADITAVKAQKILSKVMEVRNEKDLTKMTKIIADKMNDDDVTAMELAAAFLKLHMGEELEDIPVEVYKPRRARHFEEENGRKGGRGRRGDKDVRRGGCDDRRRDDSDREERRRKGGKPEKDSYIEMGGKSRRDDHHEKGEKSGRDERREKGEKSSKEERRRKERIGRDGNARNEKGRVDFGVERRLREKREKQKKKKKD